MPVLEIMTRDPVTATPDLAVDKAAAIMRERGVGSLIVVDGASAIGILTERDIVTKVAAANRSPASVRVRDIMTAPIVSVPPHEDVEEAARKMSARRIRRLPVVQEGRLVGVVTENDILRLLPNLVELTREYARAGMLEDSAAVEGHCDVCGVYSKDLARDGKLLVCPEHRDR
ncbi:MAG: CBS domain-containing protein [Methanobacteriota archaeon]|nr:MAG: CBS domain-containing protein [Euryarchaeota archaeon]